MFFNTPKNNALNAALTNALYTATADTMKANQLDPVEAVEVYMRMMLIHIVETADAGREHAALDGLQKVMHQEMQNYMNHVSQIRMNNKRDKPQIPS